MVESPAAGPDSFLPSVPQGWIAQWDANARKFYYVVISTGESTWELPTEPAGGIGTPNVTPLPDSSHFQRPPSTHTPASHELDESRTASADGSTRAVGNGQEEAYATDRGLGTMAMNMLSGKQNNQQGQQSSGLSGLAQTLLGGGTHNNGANSQSGGGGSTGGVGQLVSNLLGGSHKPQQGTANQQAGYGGNSGNQTSGGLLGSLFGGSHGSQQQQQQQQGNYAYNGSSQSTSTGGYSGSVPPSQYQPPGSNSTQQHSSYGPSTVPYNPQGYGKPQQLSQYSAPQHTQYAGPPPHGNPNAPFYVGGHPDDHAYDHPPPYSGHNGYNGGQHQGDQYGQSAYGNYPGGRPSSGIPPGQGGYNSYQPPNNQYGGGQGGGYESQQGGGGYGRPPPPPMGSHPSYGGQQHSGYGGPPQGQGGYGGPPPPAWR